MTGPTIADVRAAAGRISGVAHRTPVLTSTRLDEQTGAQVYLKAESFQRMGAFKFRGAYNALSQLAPGTPVVAFSSGNHAQAVALSARLLGLDATIVMPVDAPALKLAATRGNGARVVEYDRYTEDREAIGRRLAEETGAVVVPPFDHPDIVAGQGTAALELLDEVGELDVVLTPLGGGGLLSGTALAVKDACPRARVVGVEPAAGNDVQRSLAQGRIVRIDVPRTIADGAQTQAVGTVTFPIIRELVDEVVTATDAELVDAMRLLAQTHKIVVEPTGALGLAAVLNGSVPVAGLRVGIIVSGGNVDLVRYGRLLAEGLS